ncbi:30325_t:CDS:2, partial [Racocetra persica]
NILKILAEENLVEGEGLKRDNVNVSMQSILRTRAFFDDLNALAFVLHPIKLAISILESQNCSLADCFIGLVYLGAAIRRLSENDYHNVWTRGTFWRILLAADSFYEKMDKKPKERKMLMSQMRSYRYRIALFDISFDDNESPSVWWMSLEDYFLKDENHICQLAHILLSITPHVAGCKRIWSTLGWYRKHRTRLSLDKIENMQKLSAFYLANSKNELP